jgi:curved DNA-binding protein CbpA
MKLDAMLPVVDLYRVLQVIPEAEPEVIRAAYRALARKYHPDLGGSQAQMAMLNAAWETLCDPGDRAQYDQRRKPTAAAQTTEPERSGVGQRTNPMTPPARPNSSRARSGTVLDFGRYAGFSLGELAIKDPDYLEWLARTPFGRRLQREIEAILVASRPASHLSERPRSRLARRR